ncbi:MAG TPA: type IV toxin-antitoxin system AbiEi family antitoxin [Thermoplasmata archaeon]|nr:type IV toxin-antitoxin system AbiEi family antitoxin [Thermoplasmata archaeon]
MDVRTLSRAEAGVILALEAELVLEVNLEEIRRRARVSSGYARKLAHGLVHKGWLVRIGPGRYLLQPSGRGPIPTRETDPLRLGRRLAAPYYFGFATAAELLGLLPQASRIYYVASTGRSGVRTVQGVEFRIVSVPARHFFGLRRLQRRGEPIVVSDAERTLLDCLRRPELSGGLGGVVQVLHSAGGRLRWARVERYLRRFRSRSLALRLGHLVERYAPSSRPPPAWIRATRARPGDPYVPLGPPKEFGRRGPHDRRWHVIENVPGRRLRSEVDIR